MSIFPVFNAGTAFHALYRYRDSGTTEERAAAIAELIRRGDYSPEQIKANRQPRAYRETERERAGSWGWGGRL